MGFSNEIYSKARETVRARRSKAISAAKERHDAFTALHPEYSEMEKQLSLTGYELTMTIFRSGDGSADISAIKEKNLGLQRKMAELLAADGLPESYLEPEFTCPLCSDSGIFEGKMCECMNRLMRQLAYEKLNSTTPLELSTFESFSLEQYSDTPGPSGVSQKSMMQITLNKCRSYAENFTLNSPSMMFCGGVGLGKTHLSLAVAGEVIKRGFDVVYGSAQSFFSAIEKEHFGRSADPQEDTLSLLNSCDLLIIDDLGAEFVTQFTVSVLYDIINTRFLRSRPTIISTNLNISGLEQKYTDRIVSRISGGYNVVPFAGSDMRIILRKSRRNQNQSEI